MELIARAWDSEHSQLARNATASEAPSVQEVHASFEAIAPVMLPYRLTVETGRVPVEVLVHFESASGKDLRVPVALLTGEKRYTMILVMRMQISFQPGRHPATTTSPLNQMGI